MDSQVTEGIKQQIRYELDRKGAPEGFPAFPDIPRGRYKDPAFHELELRHLWPKLWMYVGRVEEVPEPGSYFTWNDFGAPILVTRAKDGNVRAFYNSCRHRGAPVVREACGKAALLRCQYHSWSYDLTGKLLAVPLERDFVGLDKSTRGLREIRCETWDGWIFVNQDLEAKPLLEFLRPIIAEMKDLDGNGLRFVDKTSYTINCNWKVAVEAFLEVYHFPSIHKPRADWGLGAFDLDPAGVAIELFEGGLSRMVTPFTHGAQKLREMKDALDWSDRFGKGGPFAEIPTASDMVRSTSTAYGMFPNMMIPVDVTGFPFLIAWPIDLRTTRFDMIHFAPDWGDGPPPAAWAPRIAGFDRIMKEDQLNMEPMQRALETPNAPGVPLNYQERRLWWMHENIDRVIGADRIPEALRVPSLLTGRIAQEHRQ